jgi:hypothetical protein
VRYTAHATSNATAKPATLSVNVINADNKLAKVVATNLPIGNFSESSPGFSKPVVIQASGLKLACNAGIGANPRGRLFVQLVVSNNDRPVKIALDNLNGGFNLKAGWIAEAN